MSPLLHMFPLPWCLAALPLLLACALPAQAQTDADAKALLARMDQVRGKAPATLRIDGTYAVTMGVAKDGKDVPAMKGTVREVFHGATRARQTSTMGQFGAMERGVTDAIAWELDPMLGAKVNRDAQDESTRRYFAILRGESPGALFARITSKGTEKLDGRECKVLEMAPEKGKPQTWYVDAEHATVRRIDLMLAAPESADATFAMGDWQPARLWFDDYRAIDGAQWPHRRVLEMGPAKVTFTLTRIEPGAKVEAAEFALPPAVDKVRDRQAPRITDADGKPVYERLDREAQPVATIRTKCKPSEISKTLSVILPEIGKALAGSGAKMAGPPFARYHAFGDDEIDLEAGVPVQGPITETGRVKNSELPGGKAVSVWHIGPYEKLHDTHLALMAWLQANKLETRGGPWEIYWTDPGMVTDQAKWRTQILQPIR